VSDAIEHHEEHTMSKVTTGASMSIDGYIAGPNESGFDKLFQWYGNGEVARPTAHADMTMQLTQASYEHLNRYIDEIGVLVVGRHLFDLSSGWGGIHPLDRPVVVLSHSDRTPEGWTGEEPFTFVSEGIEAAIAKAKEIAGGKDVGLNGGQIASQALNAGLLDEIGVDLVPVLLGGGTPFFDGLTGGPVDLDGPISITEGNAVTHLRYRVRR
jgi:dihydrofolate reductase